MTRKRALPRCESAAEALRNVVLAEATVHGLRFEQDALQDYSAYALDFMDCAFRRVSFLNIDVQRMFFTNCRFEQCDLPGLTMREGSLKCVEFVGCRMSGLTLEHMKLTDVLFENCRLDETNISHATIKRMEFTGCELPNLFMLQNAQDDLHFSRCRMPETELHATPMKGVDFSTCEIDGLRTVPELLRGISIRADQAPLILSLQNICIK